VYLDDIVLSGCLRSGATARLIAPEEAVFDGGDIIDSEKSISNFNLYPNPTSNDLHVSFDLTESGKIELLMVDATGKTVMVRSLGQASGNNKFSLDVNDLPAGIYMMNVSFEGQVITKRFVIQR
jgi:serine protease AprX